MWKYEVSNTDHTLMQGVELVNRLLLGEAETTIGMKYASTADGRNAAVHERAAVAGSGEKRAKTSPEAFTSASSHPGQSARPATKSVRSAASKEIKAGGPGDKPESHISEDELGVGGREASNA